MDRNSVIGIVLIFAILVVWQWISAPSPEELAERKRQQDSLARTEIIRDSLAREKQDTNSAEAAATEEENLAADSIAQARLTGRFGVFAPAGSGEETNYSIENDLMKITFSSKGGKITDVLLKNYNKIVENKEGEDIKLPLSLLEDEKNKFEYLLPVRSAANGMISSEDLFFQATKSENSISLKAMAAGGGYFEQVYTLHPGSYIVDYSISANGLQDEFISSDIQLNWVNHLDKLEKNADYERNYSTVYFKPFEEDPDYCSCTSSDVEKPSEKIKWVSNVQQFFNTTIIAENEAFASGVFETVALEKENEDLKKLVSTVTVPLDTRGGAYAMKMYIGPNKFDNLEALGYDVQDIIPFGWSIFGTINRWVIRPIFNFLSSFIGSAGLVILALTLLVKALLYPLTYKMIYSQSKMAALKPELTRLREKHKDDQQQVQIESMKMYREFGVNPLGGCLPVVLQMPIWFALYRFFPASIEFRQESFLWASDLSSYDVFMHLPFEIPFYGAHISLFTLIWVVTTIAYTYYNSQFVDYGSNPMMKYMQYAMPVMFIFFFNNFASGLTAYLCFSNVLNIGQTLVTKNYVIDNEKIRREMEAHKKKPKKKGGFQQRLEAALKEQQRVREQGKKK